MKKTTKKTSRAEALQVWTQKTNEMVHVDVASGKEAHG